ncbi:MAG: heme biosynthesis HemY N-terminal domain-containing protein [Alphaproteobacteria bacterium]
MIRVVVFLAAASFIALGVVWLADRPGQVAITWLGYRADLSVMVAAMAIVAVAVVAVILWSLTRFLMRSPKLFSLAWRERKRRRGYDAVSRGLIAIGAGDARAAQRYAANAEKSLPGEPLALLLQAQTAQLNGDRAGAEDAFRAMAERHDTRLLGLRGLYVEAQRRNDSVAARLAAEEAAKDAPALPWAGQAVLDFRCQAADWEGALAILEGNRSAGTIDRATYRRQRAVLLTARALAAEEENRDAARTLGVDAVKIAPDLVPAAALAGRLLSENGERRKATRILEAAWKANPHPDLAETYAHVRLSDSARDRLSRMQALAKLAPGHTESALAVARAALDAREFATAREALSPLASKPTQRIAMLMAELEQLEGDEGRAREWMGRALNAARDPAWTADGYVSERWLPVSPVTGRLDAFEWKVPVAELGPPAPVVIEAPAEDAPPALPPQELPREVPSPPLGNVAPENGAPRGARSAPRAAPIIPLSAIPDDPGPEPEADADAELAEPKPPDAWQRIRQLFR